MGNSQSHNQRSSARSRSSPSVEAEDLVTTPADSSPMDIDPPASNSTGPLPSNRRRSRAPSSPLLPSSISLGSARRSPLAALRSGQPTGQTPSAESSSHGTDGRPKDKKRRRLSQMLGLGSRQSSHSDESRADTGSSSLSSSLGLGLTHHRTAPIEPNLTPSSASHEPRQETDPPPTVDSVVTPDVNPLPSSRSASVLPPSSNSDPLFPSQLPPLPAPTADEESDFDPLWSPRLRAQSLISQLTQEIEQGEVVPSVAAYIGETPPVASTDPDQETSSVIMEPTPATSDEPPPSVSPVVRPSLERPTLRGRIMSSLLGRTTPVPAPAGEESEEAPSLSGGSSSTPSGSSTPSLPRPLPTGTSLIVQGLVQTSAPPRPSSEAASSSASASPGPPSSSTSGSSSPSFDEQAVLLGGLLSVATAATASSLLSPPPGSSDAAAPVPRVANSTIDSIRQRIARIRSRNSGSPPASAQGGIEEILRQYMQSNLGGGGQGATPTTATISLATGAAAAAEPDVTPEAGSFEAFLADLQTDLVRVLREFNGLPPVESSASRPEPTADVAEATTTTDSAEPASAPVESSPAEVSAEQQARAAANGGGGIGLGVEPRRLNWTRVYRFPTRDVQTTLAADGRPSADSGDDASTLAPSDGASTSESTASADPANITASADPSGSPPRARPAQVTPMIMVGVRSIARFDPADVFGATTPRPPTLRPRRASAPSQPDPSSTTPLTSPTAETIDPLDQDGDTPMTDGEPARVDPASASTPGQRLRQAMRAIRGRRAGQAEGAQAGAGGAGTRSFVLWVVGGLYSSDHPILAAPGLFGGNLDHDDLWALAELMGQVKPPIATSEDIDNSGLEIIKGSTVKTYCAEGKVLENSADRCMVCLSDYEEDEDCRILGCKHAYHLECIDKWLKVGRNACPACRTQGVKIPNEPPTAAPSATSTAANASADTSSTDPSA